MHAGSCALTAECGGAVCRITVCYIAAIVNVRATQDLAVFVTVVG